ncbi:hypothetical protein PBI_TEAMOCIL_46 [Microbacterium phage Teamocil]|uniref:Uncharacterized protein n=1 Tax=Microbacterium phage Teamocil TaxID=2656554 RepID=A0A649VWR6_9CAUD|nr:hypothetical protein QDA12_gp46 [Microbacterium phage Teamocil]QGJ88900.1 hypothetical protein PBI_GINA_46 [Microbacterium phage Gina]QGJ96997.1 hypothetical protein PBI_TEAMOCIL_46 [Microbacterium phage Teamocil]
MGAMLAVIAAETSESSMPWLTPLIAIGTLLLGSGGVVAWRRLTHDKRIGVAQQETAEDDALSNRWKAIIETQTKVLLEPMQAQIASLTREVGEVKVELEASRRKYWSAITHIRTLYNWIARHLPEDIESTAPPPPAVLAEDI